MVTKMKGKTMAPRGTKEVAKMLGVAVHSLARAVWEERIPAPPKGPGNAYLWGPEDIQRASWVLRRRSADDILENLEAATAS